MCKLVFLARAIQSIQFLYRRLWLHPQLHGAERGRTNENVLDWGSEFIRSPMT